eukprot:scaffold119128_cov25-Tisochrysis_lutea.AAC.2
MAARGPGRRGGASKQQEAGKARMGKGVKGGKGPSARAVSTHATETGSLAVALAVGGGGEEGRPGRYVLLAPAPSPRRGLVRHTYNS